MNPDHVKEVSGLFVVKGQPLTLGNASDLWHIRLGAEKNHPTKTCSEGWQKIMKINEKQNQEMHKSKKEKQDQKQKIAKIITITTI